jgi:hypothetical protein
MDRLCVSKNKHGSLTNLSDQDVGVLNMHYRIKVLILILLTAYLSGCATYGQDVRKGLSLVKQEKYPEAAAVLEKALDPKGDDRVLYYTELGLVYHLAGNYQKSNKLLSTAESISENLYTKKVSDIVMTAMSNPRQGPYRPADFERVQINYYKALNYFMLAASTSNRSEREGALEGARIESRRMDMVLSSIERKQGSYEEQADKEKSMFSKLMRIFDKLTGEIIDKNKIVYRNDAFGQFLAGTIYESHKEYDDARIAYQKAATLYENGYQKQYDLDKSMTEQAWFDTIRMMQKAGGWRNEWPKLSQKKLSKAKRSELKDFNKKGHVLVIEHIGMVPERREMNMLFRADANTRQIVASPILIGDRATQMDQRFWFYALYADKGISDVLIAINENRVGPAIMQFGLTKREYLGPLWDVADGLGLISVMQDGLRVTVPYYGVTSFKLPKKSVLMVGDQNQDMIVSQSLAHIAVQQQLVAASGDLQEAMAREAFKGLAVAKTASLAGGDAGAVINFFGKLTATAMAAAETRNWLTLPGQVRVKRVALDAGQHQLKLTSQLSDGSVKVHTSSVNIEKGKMSVWKVRSISNKVAAVVN